VDNFQQTENLMAEHFKHPHHDVITAWLQGEQIQIQMQNKAEEVWRDFPILSKCNSQIPVFHVDRVYRIKPKSFYSRLALMQAACGSYYTSTLDSDGSPQLPLVKYNPEALAGFIQWIGEPVKVEIP
jgi:hypothetical protein